MDQTLAFKNYNFDESSGVNIVNLSKPIDSFKIYFDDNICQMIVDESHLYAGQQKTNLNYVEKNLMHFLVFSLLWDSTAFRH